MPDLGRRCADFTLPLFSGYEYEGNSEVKLVGLPRQGRGDQLLGFVVQALRAGSRRPASRPGSAIRTGRRRDLPRRGLRGYRARGARVPARSSASPSPTDPTWHAHLAVFPHQGRAGDLFHRPRRRSALRARWGRSHRVERDQSTSSTRCWLNRRDYHGNRRNSFCTLAGQLILVGLYLYAPLHRTRGGRRVRVDGCTNSPRCMAERDRVVNSLQELDFDFKLSARSPKAITPTSAPHFCKKARTSCAARSNSCSQPQSWLSRQDTESRIEKAVAARRADISAKQAALTRRRPRGRMIVPRAAETARANRRASARNAASPCWSRINSAPRAESR
ncbi:MAG: hypothetical protein MZV64_19815 [Ignavibacteriales bacterium]|nr:hypothetical protein [Ignavibacteriales bacterium]